MYFTTDSSSELQALPQSGQPDSLSLSQRDLDNGLTPEQIDWLFAHLDVEALARAIRDVARQYPVSDCRNEAVAQALATAGYAVGPGVLAGRRLAQLIVKAGASW